MKKLLFLLLPILVLTACQAPRQGKVTILHTNDMHSQYIPLTATWVDQEPQPLVGGMVALEYHVRHAKEKYPNALVMDAGDFLTGTPLAGMVVDGVKGGAFVQMMNQVGYDVMTIGNHEFDNGQQELFKLLDMANFDIISANLYINDKPAVPNPYKIYNINGVRVGVIGIILSDLFEVAARKNLDGVQVKDPAKTAQKYIDKIDPKTDLIVLLTHNGVQEDENLAKQVSNADIIIGGHSHTRLPKPRRVNNILIFQAGSKTRNLGRLTLDVQGDTVAGYDYDLIDTWVDSIDTPNPELEAMVNNYQAEIDKEYSQQFGTLQTPWISNNDGESNLGNFITDAMRVETGVDFALMNSGGIRKDLPAGPVTKLDIVEILPFTNLVETFTCTGEQVLQFIRQNSGADDGYHGVMQISGLAYTYKLNNGKMEIVSAAINGEPVDPSKTYTGATVDFVLDGQADKYLGFTPQNRENSGIVIADMVVNHIKRNPDIDSRLEGRIKRVH